MDAGGYGLGFVSGSLAGQVLELPENGELGQAPDVALRVADASVAPRHAQIYAQEGAHYLLDLHSPGGTFLDGQALSPGAPVLLPPGALIRLGETGPLALFQSLAVLRRGRRAAELVVERQDGPGGAWEISGPVTVGRAGSCFIRLDAEHDVLASSEHLHLMPSFGHLVATDLGSANGTWIAAGRLVQAAVAPGQDLVLGGEGGPRFLLRASAPPVGLSHSLTGSQLGPPPIPELFRLEFSAAGGGGEVSVATKPEVSFGSFAGINDFETACFPRDLEDESDAMDRSEAIGPQHGTLVLGEAGFFVRDEGFAQTLLDGRPLAPRSLEPLPPSFTLDLGEGTLALRGRVHSHPGLAPRSPAFGAEHGHPVECLTLERSGDEPECRLFLVLVRQAAIGSADEAAIQISAPGIGPLHALLYLQAESLWITQLGADPVAVDGVPLTPNTTLPLALGSEVYLGTVRLRVLE